RCSVNAPGDWARHYQLEWQSRAGDRRLPYWLRVAALAYGCHRENGHATFKRGEIALVLGEPGKPFVNVGRAIRDAIEYGWLEPDSYWACLVVPPQAIKKGSLGSGATCRVHKKRASKPSLSERFGVLTSTSDERFEARTAHSVSGSEREPSALSDHRNHL